MQVRGFLAVLFAAFGVSAVNAQTVVNHPYNTGTLLTYTLNSGPNTAYFDYFDNGGSAGDYSNSSDPGMSAVTFSAPVGQRVRVRFSMFVVETGWDAMYVYDGSTTSAPLISSGQGATIGGFPSGGWTGITVPGYPGPGVFVSTGNSLTFTFASDNGFNYSGWIARAELFGGTIGGTVSGLTGTGLLLSLNAGAQTLPVAANGAFSFPTTLASGSNYAVTVQTQPSGPAQTCTVSNGSGAVGAANISNVSVACVVAQRTISVVTLGPSFTATPPIPATVADGTVLSFAIALAGGATLQSVTGCGGSLSGNVFTTAPITSNCTISVSAQVPQVPTLNPVLVLLLAVALAGVAIVRRRSH